MFRITFNEAQSGWRHFGTIFFTCCYFFIKTSSLHATEDPCQRAGYGGKVFNTSSPNLTAVEEQTYEFYVTWMHSFVAKHKGTRVFPIGQTTGILLTPTEYMFYYKTRPTAVKELFAVDIMPRKQKKGQIIVTAGAHAIEPAGPAAAVDFAERIMSSTSAIANEIRDFYQITIIPIIDADNYSLPYPERQYSYLTNNFYEDIGNALTWENFRDLRRPLGPGSEANSVAKVVEERFISSKVKILLDLHEDGKLRKYNHPSGFFLACPALAKYDAYVDAVFDRLKDRGIPIDKGNSDRKYSRDGTLAWFAQNLGGLGFTLESVRYSSDGSIIPLKERINTQLNAVDEFLAQFVKQADPQLH